MKDSKGFHVQQGLNLYGRIIYWNINLCLFFIFPFSFQTHRQALGISLPQ